jgi:hypothetical protein
VYVIEAPDGSTIKQFQHLVADDLLFLPGWKWGVRGTCLIGMARQQEAGLRLLRADPAPATPN